MCIAIYKPVGSDLSKELLRTCADNNPDGCGFSYIDESNTGKRKIVIKNSLDFDVFYRQYERAIRVAGDHSDFLVHFRIKTHGEISKNNCHPFKVDDSVAFIHNGMIPRMGIDKVKSDTVLFMEKILRKLPEGWEENDVMIDLIEERIGMSKLVTMNIDGGITIFNEEKGNWQGNIWYSNTSYQKRTPYTYGGSRSVYGGRTSNRFNSQTPSKKKTLPAKMEFCDDCTKSFDVNDPIDCTKLSFHYKDGEFIQLCADCLQKRINSGTLSSFDRINLTLNEEYYEDSMDDFSYAYNDVQGNC